MGDILPVLAEMSTHDEEMFTDEEVELFIWLLDADMEADIEWQEFERIVEKAKETVMPMAEYSSWQKMRADKRKHLRRQGDPDVKSRIPLTSAQEVGLQTLRYQVPAGEYRRFSSPLTAYAQAATRMDLGQSIKGTIPQDLADGM